MTRFLTRKPRTEEGWQHSDDDCWLLRLNGTPTGEGMYRGTGKSLIGKPQTAEHGSHEQRTHEQGRREDNGGC